ncbi:fork head domain protein [Oesophagostomum dentatum]|uniref:Fork head domain protein n=1 Tax=Oesophagostomum dentatum TaxID=61180 RepID=A0A0B1SZ71_OESDE|nr:fork head domain protein [Oesophagostomum dentatum]
MGDLDSSLRQLNWLIAKGGDAVNETCSSKPVTKTSSRVRDDNKPPYSYTQLIRMAIENSPGQRCSLNGIYTYIADHFTYFRENCNPSWKNSVRHNLSLNKQFKRLDKKEGEKGSLWVCVNTPEKRLRSLEGSPPRINPAIERLYMEEEDLSELSLFTSQDLSASFKAVYDQIFQSDGTCDRSRTEEQIDWLKIGMETAGIDYTSEEDVRNMDTQKFSDYMTTMFPDCTTIRSNAANYHINRHQPTAPLQHCDLEEESEDEFDWSTIT